MKLATEREMESDIVVTKKIQALREQFREHNEITYAQGGVEALTDTLIAVSDRKIYIGEEAILYFDILDTRCRFPFLALWLISSFSQPPFHLERAPRIHSQLL